MSVPPRPKPSLYQRILKSTSVYSIGLILQRIATILLLPLYTRYLTPAEYGTIELLDLSLALIGLLAGANFSQALFFFYFQSDRPERRRRVFQTVLIGALSIGIVVGCAGISGAPLLSAAVFATSAYAHYFRIMFVAFVLSLPLETCFCWIKALDKATVYAVASVLRLVLNLSLNVALLVSWHLGIGAILWSNLISTLVLSIILVVYCAEGPWESLDFPLFWAMVRYAAPIGVVALSTFIINFGDRFFLRRYTSLSVVGIYALAYKVGMSMSFLYAPFSTYWGSQHYDLLRRSDARPVFARVFTYVMLVMTGGALAIIAFARPGLSILTTPEFSLAGPLIPGIVLAYWFRTVADYLRCLFYLQKKTSWDAAVALIAALVCTVGYMTLIPRWGAYGAVAATIGGFALMAVLSLFAAYRIWPYTLEIVRLGKLAGVASILILIIFFVTARGFVASVCLGVAAMAGYPLLLRVAGFFDDAERAAFRTACGRLGVRLLGSLRSAGNDLPNPQVNRIGYAFVLPWSPVHRGGVNEVVKSLIRECRVNGAYEPLIIESRWSARKPSIQPADGYTHVALRLRWPLEESHRIMSPVLWLASLPCTISRLLHIIQRYQIRILHVHFPDLHCITLTAMRKLGLFKGRLILSFHGSDVRRAASTVGWERRLWKFMLRNADAIVAVSAGLSSEILAFEPRCTQRLRYIYNGIDIEEFMDHADRDFRLPSEMRTGRIILNIGSFTYVKGHEILIRAFATIANRFPDVRLVIVGAPGDEFDRTSLLVEKLGLQERAFLFQNVPHSRIPRFLEAATIFGMSSRWIPGVLGEGFPLAVLEAAALRRPVVSTETCGVCDILVDGENGRLVPTENPAALASAIADLLENPEIANRLADRLHEQVRTSFTWKLAFERYRALCC